MILVQAFKSNSLSYQTKSTDIKAQLSSPPRAGRRLALGTWTGLWRCRLLGRLLTLWLHLVRGGELARGSVPVVQHLRGEHSIERKARDEAVQDELVVNFLQGSEDARERPGEVVEYL